MFLQKGRPVQYTRNGFQVTQYTQDVNWTSYVRSIYVLCLLGRLHTAQKKKFSIKDFFSKYDQIRSFLNKFSEDFKAESNNLQYCEQRRI